MKRKPLTMDEYLADVAELMRPPADDAGATIAELAAELGVSRNAAMGRANALVQQGTLAVGWATRKTEHGTRRVRVYRPAESKRKGDAT